MRFLFFFVHPSKVHVFRNTINTLISDGHEVEVLVTAKDVLEDLVKNEGWNYTNIFPEGRKIKGVSPYISSGINFFRTIYRLLKYTRKRKYDLFISDDLLVYVGKIKKVTSIAFCDDDLSAVKQFSLILSMADYCLAPNITDLGKYNSKKIAFDSYKELAYLHPNNFIPNQKIIDIYRDGQIRYFILRLVSLKSYHDVGKSGLNFEKAKQLIELLEIYGKVYISAERELEQSLEKYRIKVLPSDFKHVLSGAYLYVGDSQTMSSEAAVLGVPSFRLNDFVGKISVMDEKDLKYGISKSYKTSEFDKMMIQLKKCLDDESMILEMKSGISKMLSEKIDLSQFMIWLFENYPNSINKIKENPNYQYSFK